MSSIKQGLRLDHWQIEHGASLDERAIHGGALGHDDVHGAS